MTNTEYGKEHESNRSINLPPGTNPIDRTQVSAQIYSIYSRKQSFITSEACYLTDTRESREPVIGLATSTSLLM